MKAPIEIESPRLKFVRPRAGDAEEIFARYAFRRFPERTGRFSAGNRQ